jgi:hypothetical protein
MKNHKKTGSKQGQNRVNPPKNRGKTGSIFGSKQGQNRVNSQGQTSLPPYKGGEVYPNPLPQNKIGGLSS